MLLRCSYGYSTAVYPESSEDGVLRVMYLRHGSLSLARTRTLADALAEGGDRQHSLLQPNRQCDDNK
jgi:hypothetical protein